MVEKKTPGINKGTSSWRLYLVVIIKGSRWFPKAPWDGNIYPTFFLAYGNNPSVKLGST